MSISKWRLETPLDGRAADGPPDVAGAEAGAKVGAGACAGESPALGAATGILLCFKGVSAQKEGKLARRTVACSPRWACWRTT